MKSSASESKAFQSRSQVESPGQARGKEPLSPSNIETGVPNLFRRRFFHVHVLGLAHE